MQTTQKFPLQAEQFTWQGGYFHVTSWKPWDTAGTDSDVAEVAEGALEAAQAGAVFQREYQFAVYAGDVAATAGILGWTGKHCLAQAN
jgi:hypothetical protein